MEVGDWRQTAGKAASSADTNGTGAGHGETGPGLISVRSNGRQRVSRTTQCSAVEARSRQPRSGGRQRGRTSGLTLWAPRNETAQSAGGAERRTRQSRVGPGGPGTCAAWAPCRGGDMLAARLWSRGDASARAKKKPKSRAGRMERAGAGGRPVWLSRPPAPERTCVLLSFREEERFTFFPEPKAFGLADGWRRDRG